MEEDSIHNQKPQVPIRKIPLYKAFNATLYSYLQLLLALSVSSASHVPVWGGGKWWKMRENGENVYGEFPFLYENSPFFAIGPRQFGWLSYF